MSRERKSLVIRITAIAAAIVALGGAFLMLARASEAVRWGDRIRKVEESTQGLTAGQAALANRVEIMTRDIASLKNDVDRASDRSDKGFQGVMTELAKVNGVLTGLAEQSVRTQEQLARVAERAANALVVADDAKKTAVDHMLNQATTKKEKP